MTFSVQQFRQQFPYFEQSQGEVYLDSAATTLKPQVLIDATCEFYRSSGSVHRSQYDAKHTALYEQARELVKQLIQAESSDCVIWTSGTTQSINLVANGLLSQLTEQDEIIISEADHHANFVTWQQITQKCGAKLHILPILDNWLIDQQVLCEKLNQNTKLVAINYMSNVTGTVQPVEQLVKLIREHSNALILLDTAQAICHIPIDLQQLDVDFIAFSAHKLYGPTGLGVLAGKPTALAQLQPLQYGGKMVQQVSAEQTTFADLPYRFEAGTPNIAAVIGFHAVLQWYQQWDLLNAEKHATELAEQCKVRLKNYTNCRLYHSPQPSSMVCFNFEHIANVDLATLLTEQGIALRTGEHCAQPYLARLGQTSTLRLSFAPYNQQQDVEQFFIALDKALEILE